MKTNPIRWILMCIGVVALCFLSATGGYIYGRETAAIEADRTHSERVKAVLMVKSSMKVREAVCTSILKRVKEPDLFKWFPKRQWTTMTLAHLEPILLISAGWQ